MGGMQWSKYSTRKNYWQTWIIIEFSSVLVNFFRKKSFLLVLIIHVIIIWWAYTTLLYVRRLEIFEKALNALDFWVLRWVPYISLRRGYKNCNLILQTEPYYFQKYIFIAQNFIIWPKIFVFGLIFLSFILV